jgi:hypothetical protein
MYHNLEELKDCISKQLSIEEILDLLGWDIADLVEKLSDEIEENQEAFEKAL